MYFFSCALQASAETVAAFYFLFPSAHGGLGYDPREVGRLALVVCALIIVLSTRRELRRVSRLPTRAPLRAFRIGMGSEAFAFFLLPLAPAVLGKGAGWGTWFATVLLSGALVLTTTMARAASAVLHRIASSSYAGSKFGEGGEGGGGGGEPQRVMKRRDEESRSLMTSELRRCFRRNLAVANSDSSCLSQEEGSWASLVWAQTTTLWGVDSRRR